MNALALLINALLVLYNAVVLIVVRIFYYRCLCTKVPGGHPIVFSCQY